jgi:hypothetical protein
MAVTDNQCSPANVQKIVTQATFAANGKLKVDRREVAGRQVRTVNYVASQHQSANVTSQRDLGGITEIARSVRAARGRPLKIIEVGSWVGESAISFLAGAPDSKVICVDHFQGSENDATGFIASEVGADLLRSVFEENTAFAGECIKLVEVASTDAATLLGMQDADLVFIDAGHEYRDVLDDIDAWLPNLRNDGWLCGHDWCLEFPGVIAAVHKRFIDWEVPVYTIYNTALWMVKKEEYLEHLLGDHGGVI